MRANSPWVWGPGKRRALPLSRLLTYSRRGIFHAPINVLLGREDVKKPCISMGPHEAVLILNFKIQASLIHICIFLDLSLLEKLLLTEKCHE